MVRQHVRDQKPRVVIHESRQIEPLLPPQQEGKDVGLPQLIRLGALEAPHRVLARRPLRSGVEQTRLVQDASHLRLGDSERRKALEHVADSPCPPLRVLVPRRFDRLALRHRRCARRTTARPFGLGHQRVDPARPISRQPVVDRLLRDPKDARDLRHRHSALDHLHHHAPAKLHRVRLPSRTPVGSFPLFLSHGHRPFLRSGARGFRSGSDAHQLARGTRYRRRKGAPPPGDGAQPRDKRCPSVYDYYRLRTHSTDRETFPDRFLKDSSARRCTARPSRLNWRIQGFISRN